ncbi:MAG: hypothetical protein SX243_22520 [Acidobacteriota bacterium]|nr:hypothetical protein [Acidobacteriota bacterium]
MSVTFTASNQRTTAVWLELDGVPRASGSGRLNAGETRQIQGQAGQTWVARGPWEHDGIVAVYEPTDRVPTWSILEPSTGLPEELERFNNGFYSESLATPQEFLRPDQVLKTIFLFVDFSDAPAAGASWSDEARIIQRISGGADRWLQDTSFGQSGLTVARQAGWRRMPKPATAYSDALCRCLSGSAREYLEDVAALFAGDVDFSLYDFLCVVAAKTASLDLSPAWSGLPPEGPIPTANHPISHAITFGADSYDSQTDHRLLLHEALHLCGLPDLYDGGSVEGAGKANFSSKLVGPWDLMADHQETHHLLGWHRLKLGWLHRSQVLTHFGGGQFEIELTDWTKEDGIHCLMVPLQPSPVETGNSEIDAHNAKVSRAYLIEPAPGGGVLVYSVDASVPTWECPIQIRGDKSEVRLPGLIQPGKTYRHLSSGLAVEVLQETQDGCRVAVSAN